MLIPVIQGANKQPLPLAYFVVTNLQGRYKASQKSDSDLQLKKIPVTLVWTLYRAWLF